MGKTLEVEKAKKEKDTDSKKVKALANTLFQFSEENETVKTQVEDAKIALKKVDFMLNKATKKSASLNIELGELKIILEGMKHSKLDLSAKAQTPLELGIQAVKLAYTEAIAAGNSEKDARFAAGVAAASAVKAAGGSVSDMQNASKAAVEWTPDGKPSPEALAAIKHHGDIAKAHGH